MSAPVLVIGGGVAGLRAALDLSRNGIPVLLVEREPVLGGAMATRLGDEAETFNFARGVELPRVGQVAAQKNIEVLTLSDVIDLKGVPGAFSATIRQRRRFVTDACTRCARCHFVCPQAVPNLFQSGITLRKAIYTPFKDAFPGTYTIDIETCLNNPPNYMPCQRCVEVCDDKAIHFDMPVETTVLREISAVILAVGFSVAGAQELEKFGFGTHPDIMTYLELEQLISPVGPSGGFVEKLTTNASPESVLYVLQDAGRFSCACAAAQCDKMVEQDIKKIVVLHPGKTTDGDHFGDFWFRMARKHVELIEGELERITPVEDDQLRVRYRPKGAALSTTETYDLVAFTTAAHAPASLADLAKVLGIQLNDTGFVRAGDRFGGVNATSRAGIYVAGCATGLKDIPETIAESKSATVHSMRHLDAPREIRQEEGAAPQTGHTGVMVNGKWLTDIEMRQRIESALVQLIQPSVQESTN